MRKILIVLLVLMACVNNSIAATQVTREGNNFKEVTEKVEDKKTDYTYEIKGIKYFVYLTPKGKLYILRHSNKTGKAYKSYLKGEVAETIKKELKLK